MAPLSSVEEEEGDPVKGQTRCTCGCVVFVCEEGGMTGKKSSERLP